MSNAQSLSRQILDRVQTAFFFFLSRKRHCSDHEPEQTLSHRWVINWQLLAEKYEIPGVL